MFRRWDCCLHPAFVPCSGFELALLALQSCEVTNHGDNIIGDSGFRGEFLLRLRFTAECEKDRGQRNGAYGLNQPM
jgi:hypothetical protein